MEEELSDEDPSETRLAEAVGTLTSLPRLTGRPVGHDCTWKGSSVTRIVGVQCGGVGRDKYAWGCWWAQALLDLGADIAVLSETRMSGEWQHSAAIRGMQDTGYICLSHNVPPASRPGDADPRSSGVAMAVRQSYTGQWANISLGPHGRALAASLALDNGAGLRIVGIYGPAGACLPGFTSNAEAVRQEAAVVTFLRDEVEKSQQQDHTLVVVGDLNSFSDGTQDKWQGQWQVRDDCIAAQCHAMGLIDTWRSAHPSLPGYTYVSPTGSASRLDQIWVLPAVGFRVPVFNVSLLWDWHKRVDHHPVILDLGVELPEAPVGPADGNPPSWRRLAQQTHEPKLSAAQAEVARRLDTYHDELEHLHLALLAVDGALRSCPPPLAELGMLMPNCSAFPPRVPARGLVSQLHDNIMHILLHVLPASQLPQYSRKRGRAQNAWDDCISLLRTLRRALLDTSAEDNAHQSSLLQASAKWQQGLHFLTRTCRVIEARPLLDWDGFHSRPAEWLEAIGVTQHGEAARLSPVNSTPASDSTVPTSLQWPEAHISRQARLEMVNSWLVEAERLRGKTVVHAARASYERRVTLLRSRNLKTWAASLRGPQRPSQIYTPRVFRTDTGTRRPRTPEEMRRAAAQEWQPLFAQPNPPWAHPLVQIWQDADGLRRGSPNTTLSGHEAELSALLSPGPYQLHSFRNAEVQQLGLLELKVGRWLLRKVGGLWLAHNLGPCWGPTHFLVHVDGLSPQEWTVDHWLRLLPGQCHRCLLLGPSSSDAHSAPSLLRPLSASECSKWISKMSASRPGPLWLEALLPAFLPVLGPRAVLVHAGHSTPTCLPCSVLASGCAGQLAQTQRWLAPPYYVGRILQSY